MRYNSYYLYRKYEQRDGQDVLPVIPATYSIDGEGTMPKVLHLADDPSCSEIPVLYRWVDMDINTDYWCDECPETQYRTVSGNPYCNCLNKMQTIYYQVSCDSGETWYTISDKRLMLEHNSEECGYSQYSGQFLTFIAQESCSFNFTSYYLGTFGNDMYYSLDDGLTWHEYANNEDTPTLSTGEKIMWRGSFNTDGDNGVGRFSSTGRFIVEGNVMSILYGCGFTGSECESGLTSDSVFEHLFYGCTGLTSAENMVLPATTLSVGCYLGMFRGCTSLTKAPSLLPAENIPDSCYDWMFSGCTSLTTAPEMSFTGFTGNHFNDCVEMFSGCESLTKSPVLRCKVLDLGTYNYMFSGCTSLNEITCLSESGFSNNNLVGWVTGVASNGTFYKKSSVTWRTGDNGIPRNWTVQDV